MAPGSELLVHTGSGFPSRQRQKHHPPVPGSNSSAGASPRGHPLRAGPRARIHWHLGARSPARPSTCSGSRGSPALPGAPSPDPQTVNLANSPADPGLPTSSFLPAAAPRNFPGWKVAPRAAAADLSNPSPPTSPACPNPGPSVPEPGWAPALGSVLPPCAPPGPPPQCPPRARPDPGPMLPARGGGGGRRRGGGAVAIWIRSPDHRAVRPGHSVPGIRSEPPPPRASRAPRLAIAVACASSERRPGPFLLPNPRRASSSGGSGMPGDLRAPRGAGCAEPSRGGGAEGGEERRGEERRAGAHSLESAAAGTRPPPARPERRAARCHC